MRHLEVRDLCCERGSSRLFENLGFALEAGQALVVVGSNGSGKTSLLRILAGLSRPAAGAVLWWGGPGSGEPAADRGDFVYLGHTVPLRDELSVLENLELQLAFDALRLQRAVLFEALASAGLLERRDLPARHLSLGQRRRMGLARVALSQRALWLLDEPGTGLDDAGVRWLESLLADHLGQGGSAVLTSHQTLRLPPSALTLAL
ncbi:MAG: cytochrome c biogenesis heme-transporting ATPase CcmA [Burkholderiaceae bacterium]|jgi:heme exporter protein A